MTHLTVQSNNVAHAAQTIRAKNLYSDDIGTLGDTIVLQSDGSSTLTPHT